MALFRKKKAEDKVKNVIAQQKKNAVAPAPKVYLQKAILPKDEFGILTKPHITEKSAIGMDNNIYTFEIARDATKPEIKKAIKTLYKVEPTKIRIVQIPGKTKNRGQKVGRTVARKKAYVFLKKGDSINI